jgi:hypothetical protein
MIWHSERIDVGTLIIAESSLGQFARLITDAEFKGHHHQAWLFWSAVLDLKYAALGFSKSKQQIDGLCCQLRAAHL